MSMKAVMFFVPFMLLNIACDAQQNKKKTETIKNIEQQQPQTGWKVTKELDDQGNIIRYDSTYVWSYSNNGKPQQVKVDQVLNNFRKNFDTHFNQIFKQNFGQPVWNDKLFFKNFTRPDYFTHKWRNKEFDIQSFMKQMDSLRNAFLKENYPGLEKKNQEMRL